MRKRNLWIAGLLVALAAAATAISMATEEIEVIGNPNNGTCNCPANYAPVVCKDGNGGRNHYFTNACVAGCYGFTKCEPWDGSI